MASTEFPKHVSLIALPQESIGTPIHGLYETLMLVDGVAHTPDDGPKLFEVEIVGPERGIFPSACGLPLEIHRTPDEVTDTDIVIMASMVVENQEWVTGRHPKIVEWLRRMHRKGADLCSACAGALLLAETGLLHGLESTTHWAFAPTFRSNFPSINLRIEELLVVTGVRGEFVMSGAASSWQDLIVYLISRHASPTAAQAIGKLLLYHWDTRSQTPFMPFAPLTDHGDAVIRQVQDSLQPTQSTGVTVKQLASECGLSPATFNRRFKRATGLSPVQYIQHLRIEAAKHLLERSDTPVDEVSWEVGYQEAAAFRRVFKRITTLSPGEYRRQFQIPELVGSLSPSTVGQP